MDGQQTIVVGFSSLHCFSFHCHSLNIKQREKVRFDSIASTDLLKESVEVFEKLD